MTADLYCSKAFYECEGGTNAAVAIIEGFSFLSQLSLGGNIDIIGLLRLA